MDGCGNHRVNVTECGPALIQHSFITVPTLQTRDVNSAVVLKLGQRENEMK